MTIFHFHLTLTQFVPAVLLAPGSLPALSPLLFVERLFDGVPAPV
jgi:hypothetical protein